MKHFSWGLKLREGQTKLHHAQYVLYLVELRGYQ